MLSCNDAFHSELTIIDNGYSNYTIVIPAVATEIEKKAAYKLQYYLREMSGTKLDVIPEDRPWRSNAIYVGSCNSAKKLNIDFPHLTLEEQETVSDTITKITNSYVGVNSNVTDRPIILRIRSSKVSTMQLIDLPGITNVPLLSKGQSKNISKI